MSREWATWWIEEVATGAFPSSGRLSQRFHSSLPFSLTLHQVPQLELSPALDLRALAHFQQFGSLSIVRWSQDSQRIFRVPTHRIAQSRLRIPDCTFEILVCSADLCPALSLLPLPSMSAPAGLTFEELLANLSLGEEHTQPQLRSTPSTPSTPPPEPAQPVIATPATPSHSVTVATPATSYPSGTVYYYESPTKRGVSTSWATAGTATQGVEHSRVVRVQRAPKKKNPKPRAYVIFIGYNPGVYLIWAQVEPQVSGVSSAIHRGYPSRRQAEAAYSYARARGWTRSTDPSVISRPISHLPTPSPDNEGPNPLHDTEDLDGTWYVVYRGIQPGVYHSILEASLNTSGVPNSLHQSFKGREAALRAFRLAVSGEETSVAPPPLFDDPLLLAVRPPPFARGNRSPSPPPPFA
ncbi:hypothetical protein B0H11DRAFT_2231559 [Mycena galericulata]|nr:hypothetical protein B0H11DRAFT_2231559 [Mycena galericulata]